MKVLERRPTLHKSDSGDVQVEELNGETQLPAIETETKSTQTNPVLSVSSGFKGKTYPPAGGPKNCIMSIVPHNC